MLSEDIRNLRIRFGFSQQGFADRLNAINPLLKADRNIVSRWERGQNTPTRHYQAAINVIMYSSSLETVNPEQVSEWSEILADYDIDLQSLSKGEREAIVGALEAYYSYAKHHGGTSPPECIVIAARGAYAVRLL